MALASTQIRIRNKEGIPLTKAGTYLTHIEMDNVGVSDLARSYLDLHMTFTDVAGEPIKGANVYMGFSDDGTLYDGQCLIRNARLSCEQFGILEENIKVNVYHQTMLRYTENKQEAESNEVYSNERCIPDATSGIAHILVPLSSFLGCGTQMFDHQRLGASTIRLELEFQADLFFIDPLETRGDFSITCTDIENTDPETIDVRTIQTNETFADEYTALQYFSVGNDYRIVATHSVDGAIDETLTLQNISWNGANRTVSLTFEATIATLETGEELTDITVSDEEGYPLADVTGTSGTSATTVNVPDAVVGDFLVNAVYRVGYYIGTIGTQVVNTWYMNEGVLQSATQDGDDVDLVFSTPVILFPTGLTGNITTDAGFVVVKDYTPCTWTCQQIDLVLHKLLKPPAKMGKMSYETYSLEQTNQQETSSYRKQFYTEPNAYKFCYMTPQQGCLVSEQNGAGQFRISLNNIDLTNRDIPIDPLTNGSLYNDRLVMNIDGLKNVQPTPSGTKVTVAYCDRCPVGQQNMVELRIDAPVGEDPMPTVVGHFFKTLMREV